MLEDLTALSPKRLERRLEEIWQESLPCVSVVPWEASPEQGLTVCLWVESKGRRDVTDLGRVVESEPGGLATLAWSSLSRNRRYPFWRLLLHVAVERPVRCSFNVGFAVGNDVADPIRSTLPLLMAAHLISFAFDGLPGSWEPLPRLSVPLVKAPLMDALTG